MSRTSPMPMTVHGRFSRPLAVPFADFAGLPLEGRVLDVGAAPAR